MKNYKLKKNNWTKRVLPVLLVGFFGLLIAGVMVDETTFMSCEQINDTLVQSHQGQVWDLSEQLHTTYHQKLDQCINNGFIVSDSI